MIRDVVLDSNGFVSKGLAVDASGDVAVAFAASSAVSLLFHWNAVVAVARLLRENQQLL